MILGFHAPPEKEIKSAKKAIGVLSIEYDGEWYWRYPFEH